MQNNKNSVRSAAGTGQARKRPLGFNSAAPKGSAVSETPVSGSGRTHKKAKISGIKMKKKTSSRAERSASKPSRKSVPWNKILPVFIITVIAIMIVVLVFVVIGSNKTVHQMPVILRITEEPTAEPQEAAMLPYAAESIQTSGAFPSLEGISA